MKFISAEVLLQNVCVDNTVSNTQGASVQWRGNLVARIPEQHKVQCTVSQCTGAKCQNESRRLLAFNVSGGARKARVLYVSKLVSEMRPSRHPSARRQAPPQSNNNLRRVCTCAMSERSCLREEEKARKCRQMSMLWARTFGCRASSVETLSLRTYHLMVHDICFLRQFVKVSPCTDAFLVIKCSYGFMHIFALGIKF